MNKSYKIFEIAEIIAGGDKPKKISNLKNNECLVPIFGNAEGLNGLLGFTDKARITKPAVTISARGSKVGFTAIRKEPFFPVVRLLTLIPFEELVDVNYLFYNLKLSDFEGTGSGQPQITIPQIANKIISIPDFNSQQKIAAVLSALDNKIEINNKINAELEAMAKTLYDYWFVQFEFPNSEGKPYKSSGGKMVYNSTLKREIPEGWEVKNLKDIAKTGSGGTPKSTVKEFYDNGTIPWINSGELNNPFIVSTDNFISNLGMSNSSAKLFPANSILMAMYGATAGKTSIISFAATTNQAICAVMPNDKNKLYYTRFVLENLYQYLINLSTGSARDNLSQDKIKELNVIIPPDHILDRFSEIITPNFKKIESNLKQNQELAQLRDWLLPMLMNGQVTVE